MRLKALAAAVGFVLLAGAGSVEAQGVRFAPQVSLGEDSDFGIGGRVNFDMSSSFGSPGFFIVPSFDYFFPGGSVNYWELNGNLGWLIPGVRGNVRPYIGGGLNYAHVSFDNCTGDCSNSDVGVNLMGGLNFQTRTRIMPFIEAKFELGGGEQFVLTGGIYF
jgi:opacity protein-like surface antigen